MLTNPIIEVDGNRAHVTSKYLFWTKAPDNRPTPLLAGRYVDEFVRVNGEWKIAKRTTYGAIPFRDPAHPELNDSTTAPSLEARLQVAEAKLAIARVITDYAARLDAEDFDGYAALFAHDGTWQNGKTIRHGPDEIKAMLVGLYGTPPPGFVNSQSYHLVSNIEVDVIDADHAKARSKHLPIMRDANGDPRPALAGRYEDEFVREDGHWKILHRVDYPVIPTAEEWLEKIAARRAKQ
jgi:ketosteroid isomerase-like protein